MRALLGLFVVAMPGIADGQATQFVNATRPGAHDFQVGDRFEVVVTGGADQPVSVRTTRNGRTDWSSVVGWTDSSGRWSTGGQFDRSDYGDWSELWTVGSGLAGPPLHFSVDAPCLPGAQGGILFMGRSRAQTCETAAGVETFTTPSDTDFFRTADGRVVRGGMQPSTAADEYRAGIMTAVITGQLKVQSIREQGDAAAILIQKIVGPNALSADETFNVLAIVRTAFARPDRVPEDARNPVESLSLLRNLAEASAPQDLRQRIAETISFLEAQ